MAPTPIPPFLQSLSLTHQPPPNAYASSSSAATSPSLGSSYPSLSPGGLGQLHPVPVAPTPLYLPPPVLEDEKPERLAPENFAMVSAGIYRSSFPKKKNFEFMRGLRLKTVLTLILEEYPEANLKFLEEEGIQFKQFGIPGNKEPFDQMPVPIITAALVFLLDQRNHPLLIHCNKGKHRTGCLVGCLRRLQSWSLTSTFDEYRRFSAPKSRQVDHQFIELFPIEEVWAEVEHHGTGPWLPGWQMLPRKIRAWRQVEDERQQAADRTTKEEMVLGL